MVKNPSASAGDGRDAGSIPGLGRSPGEGNGNPFQYSCLKKKSHGQRSLAGCSPWGRRVRPDRASVRLHSTAPSDALHTPHCSGPCFCPRLFAPEVGPTQDAPPQVSPGTHISVFSSLCSKATSSMWPHPIIWIATDSPSSQSSVRSFC